MNSVASARFLNNIHIIQLMTMLRNLTWNVAITDNLSDCEKLIQTSVQHKHTSLPDFDVMESCTDHRLLCAQTSKAKSTNRWITNLDHRLVNQNLLG
uniref:Uncharacterized protein n=1 Tax=Arion vulgaris TaxID=1028688 RepID=A0A0B7AU00_9EUPU